MGNTWFRKRAYRRAAQLYSRGSNCSKNWTQETASHGLYTSLGHEWLLQGDYRQAVALYEFGLPMNREFGNDLSIAYTLNALGEAARAQGDYARAEEFYDLSLPHFECIEDGAGIAWYCHNKGIVAYHRADYLEAISLFKEGLQHFTKLCNYPGVAACVSGIASTRACYGEIEKAVRLFGAAEEILHSTSTRLELVDETEYGRIRGSVFRQEEQEIWGASWEQGRNMSLAEAVEHALH